jgi:hypothetical protein
VSVIQQNVVLLRFTTPLGKRLNLRMLQQKTLKSLKNVFFVNRRRRTTVMMKTRSLPRRRPRLPLVTTTAGTKQVCW